MYIYSGKMHVTSTQIPPMQHNVNVVLQFVSTA